MDHVASDIAGAAGDQHRHAGDPLLSPGAAGSGPVADLHARVGDR
jgi:hypothetical protein